MKLKCDRCGVKREESFLVRHGYDHDGCRFYPPGEFIDPDERDHINEREKTADFVRRMHRYDVEEARRKQETQRPRGKGSR